jgi:hypothetical protein
MKASKIGPVYLMHKGIMLPLQSMDMMNQSRKIFKKTKGPKVKINKKK